MNPNYPNYITTQRGAGFLGIGGWYWLPAMKSGEFWIGTGDALRGPYLCEALAKRAACRAIGENAVYRGQM